MKNEAKNLAIKNARKATRERRKFLACKTFETKIDKSHLNKKQLDELNLLFVEAKWLYNHILQLDQKDENFNVFKFNPLIDEVDAKDKDGNQVTKTFSVLGSQIKQEIKKRICSSIIALSKMKEQGLPTGSLKFRSFVNSIPLVQFGTTYKFHDSKKNRVKIQGLKGYFKINGLKQIPKDAEFANATLIRKNGNFYLKITVFVPKAEKTFKEKAVGIDFGIATPLTLSTGEEVHINEPETERTKTLRRRLSRKIGSKKNQKKSKSYLKNLALLNKSIEKTTNRKKDQRNKIVSKIVNTFETVCVQDENIKGWKDDLFGKQVFASTIGKIIRDLKMKSHIPVVVPRYAPTTIPCLGCLKLNKIPLSQREYKCDCGYVMKRDVHGALVIKYLELGVLVWDFDLKVMRLVEEKLVCMEPTDLKFLMDETVSTLRSKLFFEEIRSHRRAQVLRSETCLGALARGSSLAKSKNWYKKA